MEIKEIELVCPCCQSVLTADVRKQVVLRWREGAEGHEEDEQRKARGERNWASAADRVEDRLTAARDKFDQGLSREKSRSKDLDDLFSRANEKLKEPEDDE